MLDALIAAMPSRLTVQHIARITGLSRGRMQQALATLRARGVQIRATTRQVEYDLPAVPEPLKLTRRERNDQTRAMMLAALGVNQWVPARILREATGHTRLRPILAALDREDHIFRVRRGVPGPEDHAIMLLDEDTNLAWAKAGFRLVQGECSHHSHRFCDPKQPEDY